MTRGFGGDDGSTDLSAGFIDGPGYEVVLAVMESRVVSRILPEHGELILGRSSDCDLVVDDASVSRHHLRIRCGAERTIEDLGSTHGSRLAGAPLAPNAPVPFAPGDVVHIGRVMVTVQQRARTQVAGVRPSTAMAAARSMIERVAPGSISVLILGETGVGKDVTAERLHRLSPRARAPFIKLNCAAFTEHLLESELFGHERGAFTGAAAAKPGLLEAASGGSVFLDEIGEMSLALQAKLLRAVEDRQIRRVGGLESRPIDVRFIAATNRDLEADMDANAFRRDLYYRLAGATVHIPPLRERRDELDALVAQFVAAATPSGHPVPLFDDDARRWLHAYAWPGNIRELKNVIERAVLLAGGGVIGLEHLPRDRPSAAAIAAPSASRASATSLRDEVKREVAELEKQRVISALAEAGGNQTRAAKILGMSRRAFVDRLDAFGLPRPRKDPK